MAKWKSVIFSDIRNKLGEQVVFSIWKGRGYMRQYVIPANPQTTAQQAHRDVHRKLVKRWQAVIDTDAKKAVWNEYALPELISGYNKFIKIGRRSKISVPSTASGTGSATVTVTYTLGLPASEARIYRYARNAGVLTDVTPPEGLSEEPNSTFNDTVNTSDIYEYFIASAVPLVEGDTPPQPYQAITKWEPDEANGVAKEAVCEVTVS